MDFGLKDLGNMAKLANEAKQLQAKQEKMQQEQIDLLKKISQQLDLVLQELTKG